MKSNANSLTAAILNYIRMTGSHAERINNISRTVKNKYGQDVHIPSAGFKGTADIHACKVIFHATIINQDIQPHTTRKYGQFVAIEVKIGRDSQSEAQKYYAECVTKAGGVYMVVHSFDEFLKQWDNI
jgi:hypothetical protein